MDFDLETAAKILAVLAPIVGALYFLSKNHPTAFMSGFAPAIVVGIFIAMFFELGKMAGVFASSRFISEKYPENRDIGRAISDALVPSDLWLVAYIVCFVLMAGFYIFAFHNMWQQKQRAKKRDEHDNHRQRP